MVYTRSSAVFGSASCKVPSASLYGCVLVTTSAERQTLGGPRSRGTYSWLDDNDKNYGPDLLPFWNLVSWFLRGGRGGKVRRGREGVGAQFNFLPPGASDLVTPLTTMALIVGIMLLCVKWLTSVLLQLSSYQTKASFLRYYFFNICDCQWLWTVVQFVTKEKMKCLRLPLVLSYD